MEKSYCKFYFFTLGVLLALSAYPIIMGIKIIILQLQNGSIRPADYARYVIPYTAICGSILISTALHPVITRLKRWSNLVATVFGLGLFVGIELFMESITISGSKAQSTVEWQLFSCIGTSAAVQAFQKIYSGAYKIHYFLVSFVIIAIIINIIYGYGKIITGGNRSSKILLHFQLIMMVILLGLCVFANFTGFFRDTVDYLSPLSAFLTGTFFVVLGVTVGIYVGSCLIGKRKVLYVILPAIAALLTCSIMYYGEFKLLGGKLYLFGYSYFFKGIPYIVVSPVDIAVIIISGVITALLMSNIGKKYRHMQTNLQNSGRT